MITMHDDDDDILALLDQIGSDPPPAEGWPQQRAVVVVDPALQDLGRELVPRLRARDFLVVAPTEIDDGNVAAMVSGRILVTGRGAPWVWDASPHGLGVVALDLLLDRGQQNAAVIARRISDAVIEHHLARRRHAWCCVLLPRERTVLRALLS